MKFALAFLVILGSQIIWYNCQPTITTGQPETKPETKPTATPLAAALLPVKAPLPADVKVDPKNTTNDKPKNGGFKLQSGFSFTEQPTVQPVQPAQPNQRPVGSRPQSQGLSNNGQPKGQSPNQQQQQQPQQPNKLSNGFDFDVSLTPIFNRNPLQPNPYQPNPYQPNPYQPMPIQPNPYQPNPYQPSPFQPNPYQPNPYQPLDPYNPYINNGGGGPGVDSFIDESWHNVNNMIQQDHYNRFHDGNRINDPYASLYPQQQLQPFDNIPYVPNQPGVGPFPDPYGRPIQPRPLYDDLNGFNRYNPYSLQSSGGQPQQQPQQPQQQQPQQQQQQPQQQQPGGPNTQRL